MYSPFGRQLFLQQSVDHAVACGLRFSLERIRHNDKPEMGLCGSAALHGLVVGVHMGVIVYIEADWIEGLRNLNAVSQLLPLRVEDRG